jgi:hypothetical protein
MSGGGTTQQVSQNKDPWAPSIPHLNEIMSSGQQLYEKGAGSQTWGGPLVASQAPQTTMGINSLTNAANSQMGTAGQPAAYGQNLIQNNGLTSGYQAPMATYGNVTQNASQPTSSATNLAGMATGADAGKDPYMMQMLQDNANLIGNRVASQMSGAGRLGSFGYGDQMARSIMAANAPILSNAYNSDKNRQLSASGQIDQSNNAANAMQLGAAQGQTGLLNAGQQNAAQWASMMPQLQNMAYQPGQQLMGVGQYQQAYNQQNIDAQRQLFEQQQAMPWTQLARYSGAVSGLSPLMANAGSMTGTQDTQKQLGLQDYSQMLGGAQGAANIGSAMLGFLSDRNEKTDIKKVGDDPRTGLPMYAYRYKDDPKTYPKIVGPMAQDVEAAMPGSTERLGGKLYIKREALGILGL